ncbi:spermidine/putrescine ABC transporter substrate-binding protein [Clostridium carnis]
MNKFKKLGALVASAILTTSLFVGCKNNSSVGENGTINVYNCADYINLDLIKKFEKETGIKVVYNTYDTNENMYQKVKSNPGQYDLVFPSDYMIEKMVKEDMVEKINFDNIPNYKNIGDSYKSLSYDPKNEYSVPYMWGTIGIIYDADKVKENVDSWNILWDEKYANEVFMFDSIRDTIAISLKRLGYSLNSVNETEINKAKEELIKQKKSVNPGYIVDEVKDKMINGEAMLATVWSGDAMYIMNESDLNLKYIVPKEGSNKWFDAMVIPKDAPNKDGAEKFIDFLTDAENAKENVEYIGYSTPNTAALDLLDDEVKNNKGAYPSKEVLDKCEVFTDLGSNLKLYDDAWTIIKTN